MKFKIVQDPKAANPRSEAGGVKRAALQSDSAEADQNSEPSLAVDPLDPPQVVAGAFGTTFYDNNPRSEAAPVKGVALPLSAVATTSSLTSLSLQNPNPAIEIVDIIPQSDSAEADQNSEPSLAVNPLDPTQMVAGIFGTTFYNNLTPYFLSTNG